MELKNKKNKSCLKWIILLCLGNLVLRLFFLNLSANFDEVGYIDGVNKIFNNHLNPFIEYIGYKTPLVYEAGALMWNVFGPTLFSLKLLIFFFSSICLLYTFLLGKSLFNETVGAAAALLLCFLPLFVTQSFLFQDPVPFTAFFLMTLYYFFEKKYWRFLISGFLFMMTKEVAVFLFLFLFLFSVVDQYKKKKNVLKSLKYLVVIPIFLIWMIINKAIFGWFLWPGNTSWLKWQNLFSQNFNYYFIQIFIDNFLWLVLGLVISGLIFLLKTAKTKLEKDNLNILVFLIFIVGFYFILLAFYLNSTRYNLFLYPIVFVAAANSIFILFKKYVGWSLVGGLIFLMCFSNVLCLLTNPWFDDGDRDLRLFSNIYLNKETVKYVEENYADPLVITTWPLDQFFADPIFGYSTVRHDFLTVDCKFPPQSRLINLEEIFVGRDIILINPRNICNGGLIREENIYLVKTVKWKTYGGDEHFPIDIYIWKRK